MSLLLAVGGGVTPVNYVLTCAVGSYTYTGQAATLRRGYSLICAPGSYAYTGIAATLTYVPGVATANYTLVCDVGSYVYSGIAATLTYATGAVETTLQGSAGGTAARKKRKRKVEVQPTRIAPVVVEIQKILQEPSRLFVSEANPDAWPRLKDDKSSEALLRAEQNKRIMRNRALAILLLAA